MGVLRPSCYVCIGVKFITYIKPSIIAIPNLYRNLIPYEANNVITPKNVSYYKRRLNTFLFIGRLHKNRTKLMR